MATINFRYDEQAKAQLEREAKKLGYKSLSEYMVVIIAGRAPSNIKTTLIRKKKTLMPVGKDGQTAKARVTLSEKIRLTEICKEEGETISFLLLRQIRILINNQPHFSREEIKLLRLATSRVTAIGRNLNQIVAKINSGVITDAKLGKSYMLQIKKCLDNQASAIRELIRKTKDRVVE